jgi:hypothetical protein
MPNGKPAGVRCAQLDDHNLCRIFGLPERPTVCADFTAEPSICGETNEFALQQLIELEDITR